MADDTLGGAAPDQDPYPIKVRGPDGTLHPFPAGTTSDQIDAAMQSRYAPRGIAQPGAATPQAGAVQPFNQSVPEYMAPEDWRNAAAVLLFGDKNRSIGQAFANTPGHTYRTELAKKTADEVQRRQDAQFAGTQILKSYAQLLDRYNNTPDDALRGATGPRNLKPYKDWLPFVGGMTEPEAAASYSLMPNMTGSKSAQEAFDTQNLFSHDVHGIINAFMTGAGKSLHMSDARQAAFDATMRDFMKATNRQSGLEILEHAKHIIANDFNIPIGTANSIINQYIKDARREQLPGGNAGANAGAQPHREQMRNAKTGQMETLEWDGKTWKKVMQ